MRRRVIRRSLIATFVTTAVAAAPAPAAYPPDTELARIPTPQGIPRPAHLQPILDPTFGTRITRVSDGPAFGQRRARWIRHAYAKNQPWNADGSLLMLDYTYPAPLLDGRTYERVGRVHQPSEAIWLNTDPNRLIGVRGNRLVLWDARADRGAGVLRRFSRYGEIELGSGEGNLSNDDRYAALFGLRAEGVDVLVYDVTARRVVGRRAFAGARVGDGRDATFNNVAMSQSGDRVVLQYNRRGRGPRRGIVSLNRSLRDPLPVSANGGSHYDVCVEEGGREVLVAQADRSAAVVATGLADGVARQLLPARLMGWPIHISCRNVARPGWAYLSEFADREAPRLANEDSLLAVKLDGSGTVERFGHEFRSRRGQYAREAHAVPDRTGERVLWASDWQRPRGPVYAYVAEQP